MRTQRRRADNTIMFLFNWMPQQLSFILLTLSLVFFLNYIQSIYAPNIKRVIRIRYKVPAVGVTIRSEDSETSSSITNTKSSSSLLLSSSSSKLCQLALANAHVPRIDVNIDVDENENDYNNMISDSGKATTITTPLAHVSTLRKCSLNSRTTIATASVKLIDKAMPTQLMPLQRSTVTTNFNNILNNTNTILNYYNYYSKATFVHRQLNRSYNVHNGSLAINMANLVNIIPIERANGTTNLTNDNTFVEVFIALYTANSDHNKLNNISNKFSIENDISIRYNFVECSVNMHQHQHKHYCNNSDCRSCNATALVRCYR